MTEIYSNESKLLCCEAAMTTSLHLQALLHNAAKSGDLQALKDLASEGVPVATDLALRNAVRNGHLGVVRFLLDQGAQVNLDADAPLGNAAQFDHCDIARLLLDRGADIHGGKDSALHYAVEAGHAGMVELLVARGADIHACCEQALKIAALEGRLDILEFLLQKGAALDRIGQSHIQTAFETAVRNGHTRAITVILDHGAHPDYVYPLHIAAQMQPQAMALLLERGANRTVAEELQDHPETCAESRAVIQSFFLRERMTDLLSAETPQPASRRRTSCVL